MFSGQVVTKKYSKDFLAKDTFMWISPSSRTIHWTKKKNDMSQLHSKYVTLEERRDADPSLPLGQRVGSMVRHFNTKGGVVLEFSDECFMELKMKEVTDWHNVLDALTR